MEKIWLKTYPQNVPAEIDTAQLPSLVDLFVEACARYDSQVAFISMGTTMTYRQLDQRSQEVAGWLQSLGLQKGDRVALMMPNLLQYPVALFGTLRAGCVVVNCNPLYTPRELEYQLQDSGAQAIVIVENFAHTLEQVLPRTSVKHVVVTPMGEMLGLVKGALVNWVVRRIKKLVPPWRIPGAVNFSQVLLAGRRHGFTPIVPGREDIAFLQYTGGTTGVAKAAILTHANITANVTQAYEWIKGVLRDGEELIITPLPLYHIFALTVSLTLLRMGARNLLIANPRDIPNFVKEWRKYPISIVTGVNTLFNALLNNPDFAKLDFSPLRVALGGGMAVQAAVAERWLRTTGVPLLQAYGLTETSPAVTINPLDMKAFNGAIGLPIPSTNISIRDDAGKEVPPGEIGEICVNGPQVTQGYWQRPDETALAFTPDGFLRTGDMGYVDPQGFVFLVDRKKDMIIVSGFKVYPNEVDEVVAQHPGVVEAAAVGVPDERCGEVVKLYVVRRDASLTGQAIIDYCRSQLTGYKVPKHVEFRDTLPKTNVGKILRRALREG